MNAQKKMHVPASAAMLLLSAGLLSSGAVRAAEPDNEELAAELTALMRAARAVISDNQNLINDATVGDKGLSGDKVLAQAKDNYKKATGKNLPTHTAGSLADNAQKAMLNTIPEVMNKNQILINEKGKAYKGFLPAVFARQVAEGVTAKLGGQVTVKLTAPKSLIRNRTNKPDEWEHAAIEQQFRQANYVKGKPYSQVVGNNFRYIAPEYYGATCLQCHGEPKGERDISGGLKEGAKLGDLGGAISLTIVMKK